MDKGNYSIAISKQQISAMPTVEYHGTITLIETAADVAEAVAYLRSRPIVGFDTETKPNFRKGVTNTVSLMQISTADHAFLFRLNKIGFPEDLRMLLECDEVVKVGLSLKDDFHMLHKLSHFAPCNFVELQNMVKNYHITDMSLQKIYAILFSGRISKGQRLTNWEAPKLSEAQLIYASIDAWACLRIFEYLRDGLFDPSSSPYIVTAPAEDEGPDSH